MQAKLSGGIFIHLGFPLEDPAKEQHRKHDHTTGAAETDALGPAEHIGRCCSRANKAYRQMQ